MTTNLRHPMFQTLRELRGNPRACVLTEPMFGVPYNMFMPFMSVYMLALGVTDQGIGLIASLSLASQILSTLVSGAIVDKYGRRLTLWWPHRVLWPLRDWAASQNMTYLVVAPSHQRHLAHLHTPGPASCRGRRERTSSISGRGSPSLACTSFFTPLGGWFVSRFGLVPAMRGLLLFGFVMLTAKAVILYVFSHETERGLSRLQETHGRSLFALLGEYRHVVGQLVHSRPIRVALSLMLVTSIYGTINSSFWAVLFTSKCRPVRCLTSPSLPPWGPSPRRLHVPHRPPTAQPGPLSAAPLARLGLYLASQTLLVLMTHRAVAATRGQRDAGRGGRRARQPHDRVLARVSLESHERARISAMVYMTLLLHQPLRLDRRPTLRHRPASCLSPSTWSSLQPACCSSGSSAAGGHPRRRRVLSTRDGVDPSGQAPQALGPSSCAATASAQQLRPRSNCVRAATASRRQQLRPRSNCVRAATASAQQLRPRSNCHHPRPTHSNSIM
jgi:MFS family permease